jgi:hypothetical protein
VLLCVIIIPLLVLVNSAAWTIRGTVLEPSFYAEVLKKAGIYEAIPVEVGRLVAPMLESAVPKNAPRREELLSAMRNGLTSCITPSWIEDQVQGIVRATLAYLKGEGPLGALGIDLTEPKANLAAFMEGLKLPGQALAEMKKGLSQIPDRIGPTHTMVQPMLAALSGARPAVQAMMVAASAGAYVFGLVVFGACIMSGSVRAAGVWVGSGLLLGGTAAILATLLGRFAVMNVASGFSAGPGISTLSVQTIVEMASEEVLSRIQVFGAASAGVGALAVMLALLFRPKQAAERGAAGPPAVTEGGGEAKAQPPAGPQGPA